MLRLKSGDFELSVLASSYRRGVPYSNENIAVDFDDSESYERDHALRLELKHEAALSSLFQLTSRVYGDAFGYQRQLNAVMSLTCARGTGTQTCTYHDVGRARWAGIEERLALDWLGDGSLVTTLGADLRAQWVQTKQDEINFDTGQPLGPTVGRIDDSGTIVSPYVQQVWSPLPWLDLNGGARLDVGSRFSAVVSPRGALAVRPSRTTAFKAIYSEAFRAPTWSETDLANYRVAPSNLEPEKVRSVEGSVEQRFETQRVYFGLFRTWWKNLIAQGPLSADEQSRLQRENRLPVFVPAGMVQYGNVASLDNYGLSASWDGSIPRSSFFYGANLTEAFTRRQVGRDSQPLAIAPQLFGNARVAYVLGGYAPTVALAVSYVGPRPADRALVRGDAIPYARALAQFRLTLTGKVPMVGGLSYRASAALATASQSAYTAGPNIAPTYNGAAAFTPPPLGFAPVDQFSAFVGLQYDFATGEAL
jgi:outer membrane receptor protein involved in Fe transport